MIVGVREHDKVKKEDALSAGFDCVEKQEQVIAIDSIINDEFLKIIESVCDKSFPYIVISTVGTCSLSDFKSVIARNISVIVKAGIPIYIENGMKGDDLQGYTRNDFSDTRELNDFVNWANKSCYPEGDIDEKLFGICVNTGYVNLLCQSIRLVLEGAGNNLKLIHVNDNDGLKNMYQMPYSFTKGRGELTTDYYRFVGTLSRMKYDERLIFDVIGLFNRAPKVLIPNMLDMLASVAMFWLHIIDYEGMLDCGKKIILFGSGRMAGNFLNTWGDKYKPIFIVDNDKRKYGTFYRGIEVKEPTSILSIPQEERMVILCSSRYEEIGMQLDKMGVEYIEYDDNYFDFIVQ